MTHQYRPEGPTSNSNRHHPTPTPDEAQLVAQSSRSPATAVMQLQRAAGNAALQQLLRESAVQAVQRAPRTEIGIKPVEVQPAASDEKTNVELAQDIMGTQLAILEYWETALENFDKVMTSQSNKAGQPNFKRVLFKYLEDKVVGELFKRSKLPGVGEAFSLMNKMGDELTRAEAAKDSASLRDFFVTYRTVIGKLKGLILSTTTDFVTKVRQTEEAKDRDPARHENEWAMLRIELIDTLAQLDYQHTLSTPENVFRLLSEQWLRDSTVSIDQVGRKASYVFIRLEADYTVRDAHIFGTGGQKIAERLLLDTPGGIDVYSMKVPRFIHYFKEGARGATAVLKVDEKGIVDSKNSDGNYRPVHERLQRQGLAPTTKITGE